MKQIIIFLLLVIAFFIGYGKYNQYKRYNFSNVNYTTNKTLDVNYYNQEFVINYYKAIEDLNSYVVSQWTANKIDVRTPKNDDEQTKLAIKKYANKLATIKFYETKLENSNSLKKQGFSNTEIQFLETTGTNLKDFKHKQEVDKIKNLFNQGEKLVFGKTSPLIFELQKQLNKKGFKIDIDGVYQIETLNAIKNFEEKNNLFPDGKIDLLTLDTLYR